MRHFIKKQFPAREENVLDTTTCDLCGKVAKSGGWDSSFWQVNETEIEITVRQKDGESYPDSGYGTKYEADICPECFKNKLIPWLESQGCTAKREDWDWG